MPLLEEFDFFSVRRLVAIVVQLLHCVRLFVTPWTEADQASLSFTVSWNLLKFMSIELMMLSSNFILCHPLLLLPSVFPSIRVFSNELALHIRWPKYWSFSFSISPSNEYSGLILTGLISLLPKWLSRVFSSTTIWKHNFFGIQTSLRPALTSICDYWRNHSFDYAELCWPSDVFAF